MLDRPISCLIIYGLSSTALTPLGAVLDRTSDVLEALDVHECIECFKEFD